MPQPKTCIDCHAEIALYADFPGPRCLSCHDKKHRNTPPTAPDFVRALRLKGGRG